MKKMSLRVTFSRLAREVVKNNTAERKTYFKIDKRNNIDFICI